MSSGPMNDGNTDYAGNHDTPLDPPYTLYVGGLPPKSIQADLETIFENVKGQIVNVRMIRDRESDIFRGFAYVEFSTEAAAREAMTYDGADFAGNTLRIDLATRRNKGYGDRSREGDRGGYQKGGRSGMEHNDRAGGRYNNNFNAGRTEGGGYQNRDNFYNNGARQGAYGGAPRYDNRDSGSFEQRGGGQYHQRPTYDQGGQYGQNGRGDYGGSRSGYGDRDARGGYGDRDASGYSGNRRDGRDQYQQRGYGYNRRRENQDRAAQEIITPVQPAEGREKLKLEPRKARDPINALAESAARSKIFGDALPREFNPKFRQSESEGEKEPKEGSNNNDNNNDSTTACT